MINKIVESKRNIYTASSFAKESLIYLQEVGKSKSLELHTTTRKPQSSYLVFVVNEGHGTLIYANSTYSLHKGNIVFIDCSLGFKHISDNWDISWVHFDGTNVKNIYDKYVERKGLNVFLKNNPANYTSLIEEIYLISTSSDYLKDYKIYEKIVCLTSLLMSETSYKETSNNKKYDIEKIKEYLNSHYLEEIYLDQLSNIFFINKYYLTRLFKDYYGKTITDYINELRIKKAKELLRFSAMPIDEIAEISGFKDASYFSRLFKKTELITPNEYRRIW